MRRAPQIFYALLAVAGAVVCWTYNIRWMLEQHRAMTTVEFLRVGFTGSALLGSLAADFWIGTSAALVWMLVEARRLGMKRWWIWLVLTVGVAFACAFPLFLCVRESLLRRRAETATPRATG